MNDEAERAYKKYFERPINDSKLYKNRAEEDRILERILEGELQPRNDWEEAYLSFMGGPFPKASRPKKVVECCKCHTRWEATGYPSGRYAEGNWLWPTICECCADFMDALALAKKAKQPSWDGSGRSDPYKDE
jgi:hypothetical protein